MDHGAGVVIAALVQVGEAAGDVGRDEQPLDHRQDRPPLVVERAVQAAELDGARKKQVCLVIAAA